MTRIRTIKFGQTFGSRCRISVLPINPVSHSRVLNLFCALMLAIPFSKNVVKKQSVKLKNQRICQMAKSWIYVGREGLDPSCLAAQHFKCRAYTNSATDPCLLLYQIPNSRFKILFIMRSEAELNRCKRFCRPLPNHSAIGPFEYRTSSVYRS